MISLVALFFVISSSPSHLSVFVFPPRICMSCKCGLLLWVQNKAVPSLSFASSSLFSLGRCLVAE